MELTSDLRIRTTLVCGALALAIGISSLFRSGKVKRSHWLFAAFSGSIGFWYLSQTLYGFFQDAVWARARLLLAVLIPVFLCNLFEAMVPAEDGRRERMGKSSVLLAMPMLVLVLSPYFERAPARVALFMYCVTIITAGLYELGQRGLNSQSRATQRRVRFLVVIGALAGMFSVLDFVWVLGYEAAYEPPPIGVVLSIVFLFVLAQALRHERLLDLYEMLGRAIVATLVAFLIAGVFYLLVVVLGQFNTMFLNAVLAAIVVLVIFNPLRDWVELQIQRIVFREQRRLVATLADARRRLAHTLEVDEMGNVVMRALERSRSMTNAALYLLAEDGTAFDRLCILGEREAPIQVEVATANALLEQLDNGALVLERLQHQPAEKRSAGDEAVIAAAEVLGPLKSGVVIPIRVEDGDLVGILVLQDVRIRDAFSSDDVVLLEALAAQIGVVVENSRVYTRMKDRDRLAVLGQMAAGLAHEIRNPLGAIKGAAQLLADPGPDDAGLDEASREFVGIILEEVDRLNDVVGSVLDLARQNTDLVAPINVNAVVRRTLQVIAADADADTGVHIEPELAEDLPRAAIPAEQLRQVVMNLVRNAVQATQSHHKGRKGTVRVTTRVRRRRNETDEDAQVEVAVRDDGPGIPPTQIEKIFLPFYTTKDDGTGLGLAISQRMVQSAGGRIEVRSRVGEGTSFMVVLPAAMEALGTPKPALASLRPSANDEDPPRVMTDSQDGEVAAAETGAGSSGEEPQAAT